ncbi:MAG: beta-propeller fold lactonase family protein, partial [Acidobacteria bacterium]|nr:beta-propeller fold lactonase family protein [Acidobacteriota bacterium]
MSRTSSKTRPPRRIAARVTAVAAAALACLGAAWAAPAPADAATITKQFNGSTWQLIAGFRQPTTSALATTGIRSLFTTDQNSGLTSTAGIFSTVTSDGGQYANQDVFGVRHNAYLLEGYEPGGASRNIQGIITTGAHTWTQLGTATIGANMALPSGITVTGASLFNAAGAVTPTYRYLAQGTGAASGLFTANTGDFILMGVTDSGTQGTADALDTTFNGASNSIGLGLSDGNGVGQTVAANWAQPSTGNIGAITTRSAGNAHGGSVSQAGANTTGWVLVWGRPEAIITPVADAVRTNSLQFRLDFAAGTPTGLTASDFTVGGTSTGWSVTSVTGSGGGPYTATLDGVAPTQGTVTLALNAGSVTIGGNSFPSSSIAGTGPVTYDTVAPAVSSFTASALTTVAGPITYTLNLSEAPSRAPRASDFVVSGSSSGWTVSSVTGSGTGPYTVTLANNAAVVPNGTVNVGVRAASIPDAAGNLGPVSQVNAGTVTVFRGLDSGTPTVNALTTSASTVSASPITYTLMFDQRVTGLAASDFSIGGTSTGWAVSSITGSGAGPYTLSLTRATPLPGGTVVLTLRAGSVLDGANVQGPLLSSVAPTVTVDTSPVNTVLPVVSGPATTNGVLTGTAGTWTGPPTITYAYQWQVSESGTGGWVNATGTGNATATYSVANADLGDYLRLRVTATNSSGSVSAVSAVTARVVPGASLLVAQLGTNTVGQFPIGAGGALGPVTTAGSTDSGPRGITVTPDNAYAYTMNTSGNSISQFAVQPDGSLSPLSTPSVSTGSGTTPWYMAITPDQRFAYVTYRGTGAVGQFRVLSDGRLVPMPTPTIAAAAAPEGLAVNPAGTYLYAASRSTNQVFQYAIDQVTGQLSPLSTPAVSTSADPCTVVISPNGQYAYVSSQSGAKIDQYAIGAGGLLTPMTPANVAFTGAHGGAVSPDGRHFYGGSYGNAVVGQFGIGGSGALTPLSPATIAASTNPVGIVVTPDGANVYQVNYGATTVSQYSRNASTGVLTALSPATAASGSGPWGAAFLTPRPAATLLRAGLATGTASTMTFTVRFNQWVSGLDASDFSVVGGATGWTVQSVTGSGAGPYTVTVTGGGAGTANLRLSANAVTGNLGNAGPTAARLGIGGTMGPTPDPTIPASVRVSTPATAAPGSWVGEGLTFAYQWQVSDDGATGWASATGTGNATATYTPATGDLWKYVRVRVTATSLDGATATMTSAAQPVQPPEMLYMTNSNANTVGAFRVQGDGSLGTMVQAATGDVAPRQIALTPDRRYAYAANSGGTTVSQFSVAADGTLTLLSPQRITVGSNSGGVQVTPDGRFAYVSMSGTPGAVAQYAVSSNGQLAPLGPANLTVGGDYMRISPNGRFVYVANWVTNRLHAFSVGATGALTLIASYTTATAPRRVSISPDGSVLALAADTGNVIQRYTIGADGALTEVTPAVTVTNPWGAFFAPSGSRAYVTAYAGATVTPYSVGAGASFTALPGTAPATAANPMEVVFRSGGANAYVSSFTGNVVSQYAVGGDGALAPLSPRDVTAGSGTQSGVTTPLGPGVTDLTALPVLSNGGTATWAVSFNRPVTGLAPSDFSLGGTPGGWTVQSVTGSGAGPYTVTATGGTGVTAPVLTLAAGTVTDPAGNAGPAAPRSAASISLDSGAASAPTASPSVIRVGQPITGTGGTWAGAGVTLAYQWQVSSDGSGGWANATGTGAATLTYTPAAADAWRYVRLRVTATNAAGSTEAVTTNVAVRGQETLAMPGITAGTVSMFPVQANGALGTATTITAGTGPSQVYMSPDGAYAYVLNSSAGTISQYAVDAGGGLTALTPATVSVSGLSGWSRIIMTPDQRFAYVTASPVISGVTTGRVYQFAVTGTGRLVPLATEAIAAGNAPRLMAVNPAGTRLFVLANTDNQVRQFVIDPATGQLSAASTPTVTVPSNTAQILITPNGSNAYVSATGAGSVSQFGFTAGGLLTPLSPATVSLAGAYFMAATPDSQSLYVGVGSGTTLAQYTIGAGGLLSAKSPATVAVPSSPNPFVMRPNGQNLYVASWGTNAVAQYAVAAGTGNVTALSPASVTTSAGPGEGVVLGAGGPAPRSMEVVPALSTATSLSWKVTFNRPVSGVEASDFSLGASAGSWAITGVTGSGEGPYTVTASGSGSATVALELAANSVTDVASTTGPSVARRTTSLAMNPAGTALPTVPAGMAPGSVGTATAGTWVTSEDATTYAYQWQVSDDGATGWTNATGTGNATASYTLATADLFKYLRVQVTATTSAGSASALSQPSYVPVGDRVVATNNSGSSVTTFAVRPGGGLAATGTMAGHTGARGIAATPDGQRVYVVNGSADTLSRFNMDDNGVLMPQGTIPVPSGAFGATVSPSGGHLYVANRSANSISQFSIGAGGALTALSPATVSTGSQPHYVTINAAGTRAYVANRAANTISQFSIGAGGTLTALSPATVAVPNADPVAIALTPNGSYAYVTSYSTGKVTQYAVNADGTLALLNPSTVNATGAYQARVTPDGGSLLVTSWSGAGVFQFAIGAGGQLSARSPAAAATPTGAANLVLDPDGLFGYVGAGSGSDVAQYSLSGGLLTALSPATAASGGAAPVELVYTRSRARVAQMTPAATWTNATSFTYSVKFSRPVTGLAASDFTLGGTAAGWTVQSVTGSGAGPYTVTVGGSSTGTVLLTLPTGTVTDENNLAGP